MFLIPFNFLECIQCQSCKTCFKKFTSCCQLQLPIQSLTSVEESLNSYFKPELMEGNDKYLCSVCNLMVGIFSSCLFLNFIGKWCKIDLHKEITTLSSSWSQKNSLRSDSITTCEIKSWVLFFYCFSSFLLIISVFLLPLLFIFIILIILFLVWLFIVGTQIQVIIFAI